MALYPLQGKMDKPGQMTDPPAHHNSHYYEDDYTAQPVERPTVWEERAKEPISIFTRRYRLERIDSIRKRTGLSTNSVVYLKSKYPNGQGANYEGCGLPVWNLYHLPNGPWKPIKIEWFSGAPVFSYHDENDVVIYDERNIEGAEVAN